MVSNLPSGWIFIIGLVCCFVFWALQEYRECGHFKITSKKNQENTGNSSSNHTFYNARSFAQRYCKYLKKPKNVIAFLTLIAICYYTWLTQAILEATRHSYADVQRAFVFRSGLDVGVIPFPASVTIQPVWENSGSTPTKDLSIYNSSAWCPTAMKKTFKFPNVISPNQTFMWPETMKAVIGPKASYTSQGFAFTVEQIKAINARQNFSYIWGWARYKDVFQRTPYHITRFCIRILSINGSVDPPNRSTTVSFSPCDYGNCADSECVDEGFVWPGNSIPSTEPPFNNCE